MAAPLGFKTFNTGDVLSAADTNGYLMQGIWVFADATARDAAVTSPQEGNSCYLKDTDVIQVYSGSSWVVKSGGSSPLTTKGDLYTYSTTDARLAVGANGTTLVADSAEATGLKWQAAAGGSKTYTLLNSGGTTLSGSSSVVVSVTTKEDYYVLIIGASCGSRQEMLLRINGDTGSNYITTIGNIDGEPSYSPNNFSSSGATGTSYRLSTMSTNAASTMNAGIYVGAGNSTTLHPVEWQGSATPSGGNAHSIYIGTGFYSGSAAITSFTILSAANFDAGTVYVYGA
jgi:hypothetical protein